MGEMGGERGGGGGEVREVGRWGGGEVGEVVGGRDDRERWGR